MVGMSHYSRSAKRRFGPPIARTARATKSSRAYIPSPENQVEIAYISKRGRREINTTGEPGHFLIQEVNAASGGGSYWSTVEEARDETYAIERATGLAMTERRSMRVARYTRPKQDGGPKQGRYSVPHT